MPNKLPVRLFNIKTMETVIHHDFPKSVLKDGYVAVSHVWGEQTFHNPENLGIKRGVNWRVPLSDTKKMDMLTLGMKKFKMEWCWWDVLCMPQGENNQHLINKEIPYMGDYYNGAKVTFVLSGKEGPDGDVERLIVKGFIKGFTAVTKHTSVTIQILALELEKETWFERLWTFQEAVMSKQIWLIGHYGNYIDISDIMKRVALSNERLGVIDDDTIAIVNLARAIRDYSDYKTSVGRMLYECRGRKCYKPEDKFYGALGVLGYTNFPVIYGIDMKNLMREFMEYAYYKEDVSWLAIHVNGKTGFIPSHENLEYIGELWREENPGMCNIIFKESTLFINACITANVTQCLDVSSISIDAYDIYEEWGLHESDVIRGITGHCRLSDGEVNCLKSFRRYDTGDIISFQGAKTFGSIMTGGNMGKLMAKKSRHTDISWKIASKVVCIKTGKVMLITVCGDCNVGDKIMLLPMYDIRGRALGIVVDDKLKRKGICLYPKLDIFYEYTPHEFQL